MILVNQGKKVQSFLDPHHSFLLIQIHSGHLFLFKNDWILFILYLLSLYAVVFVYLILIRQIEQTTEYF
jgi:hypothetical protein